MLMNRINNIIKYRKQVSHNNGSFRSQWEKDAKSLDNYLRRK